MKQVLASLRRVTMAVALVGLASAPAFAQGVTTGSLSGVVTDGARPVAGANVIAIHQPSGTVYEATSRADGRFFIPGMRVGGPYSVTVAYTGTGTAFEPQTQDNVTVNLGVATDLSFAVSAIAVVETVIVTGQSDPVFASNRTGAATALSRDDLGTLPTFTGRLNDVTRLTPQAGGGGSFAGQDNRLNNTTVDGSYFNNSFGLGGAPGERTGVTAVSLESIEQVQVSVAPFDVRQGNFVGAGVNTVTRSGTNQFTAPSTTSSATRAWSAPKPRARSSIRARSASGTRADGSAGRSCATGSSSSPTTRTRRPRNRAPRSAPTSAANRWVAA
jgi:hypothetical protein